MDSSSNYRTERERVIHRMTKELDKMLPQNRPTQAEIDAARFNEEKRRHAWSSLKRNHPGIRQVQQYLEHTYPRKFCVDDVLRVLINNFWSLRPGLPDFPEDELMSEVWTADNAAEAATESLTC